MMTGAVPFGPKLKKTNYRLELIMEFKINQRRAELYSLISFWGILIIRHNLETWLS